LSTTWCGARGDGGTMIARKPCCGFLAQRQRADVDHRRLADCRADLLLDPISSSPPLTVIAHTSMTTSEPPVTHEASYEPVRQPEERPR
jgi:hypothetical protein